MFSWFSELAAKGIIVAPDLAHEEEWRCFMKELERRRERVGREHAERFRERYQAKLLETEYRLEEERNYLHLLEEEREYLQGLEEGRNYLQLLEEGRNHLQLQKLKEVEARLQELNMRLSHTEQKLRAAQARHEEEQKKRDNEEQKKRDNEERLKREEAAQWDRFWKEFEEKQKQEEERLKEQRRKHEETLKREAEAEKLRNQEHRAAKEKLERLREALNKGITPILDPTEEELSAARAKLVGGADRFHCAVAGNSGSGKSSLINALRGVPDGNARAAAVGVTETTMKITAYPDSSADPPRNRFVWYDIPGAGTLTIPGPVYFNSQGLFVFDLIIVVVDVRFTTQDISILENCVHFKIPSFIVRSKADQHIHNIIRNQLQTDLEDNASEDEAFEDFWDFDPTNLYKLVGATGFEEAKKTLVTETRESFRGNLLNYGQLDPNQKVYIVSADLLCQFATRVSQKKVVGEFKNKQYLVDERELTEDLFKAIRVS